MPTAPLAPSENQIIMFGMPTKRVTATEAARKFSDLLNRVRYRGEELEIVRGGEVVARLVPAQASARASTVGDLLDLLESVERPDAGFADDLEAVQRDQSTASEDPWAV